MSKVKDNFKQYGFWGFLKRSVKAAIRKLGVNYESYYYIVNDINYEQLKAFFESRPLEGIRELSYQDYVDNPQIGYTGKRLELLKERFDKGTYRAFGVETDGKLVYTCMISMEEFCVSQKWLTCKLDEDEGYLLDAYCAPEMRGKGIHGTMNALRLMKLWEAGKKKCSGVVVVDNVPSLKSQLKVGYKIVFRYYILEIGNKHYTNFYKKKSCLK